MKGHWWQPSASFTGAPITWRADGQPVSITLANGVATNYAYDDTGRLAEITTAKGLETLFKQDYTYDQNSNITNILDKNGNNWVYNYDRANQLTSSTTPGTVMDPNPTHGYTGLILSDYTGNLSLDFLEDDQVQVMLDYDASSQGLDFGEIKQGIKRIVLTPDMAHKDHRLTDKQIEIYISDNNIGYIPVSRNWLEL